MKSLKIMVSLESVSILQTCLWIGVGTFLVYLAKKIYDQYRMIKMVSKFDIPKDNSLILGDLKLLVQPTDVLNKEIRIIATELYPHFSLRILHDVAVVLLAPEDFEIFMATKKHSRKSYIYSILANWLKEGLLLSSGDKWLSRRKILTPAFHFNILKGFVNIFNEHTEKLLKTLSENCTQPIDVVPLISESTLFIINETAMGHQLDPDNEDQQQYRNAIYEIEKLFIHRLMRPWMLSPTLYYLLSPNYREERRLLNILHKFTRSVIDERLKTFTGISDFENEETADQNDDYPEVYMNGKKKRLAMLDILLEAHKNGEMSFEGICEEVDTFMFEGHDTTSAAISFLLMLLANHPEIQEQVHDEISSIFRQEIRKPTYNDLQQMDLLERVIKESLRLYPSVHFISRLVDEDTVLHSGLVVPKNVKVHLFIADLHRNPNIYPDPHKFDPDRFLPENCQNRHPFAYLPFSAGPRNCIGQRFALLELKAVVTGIIQRFKLKAVDTPDSIVLTPELVLRTKHGIKIKFDPRC